mgnify:CR=1 FL=1
MEGSIIFYTYGSTLELNGQQFEAGRLTEDLLNLSPDDYHPLHERMVRIRTLMDIYEYVRKSELWWKLNDEMEQLSVRNFADILCSACYRTIAMTLSFR